MKKLLVTLLILAGIAVWYLRPDSARVIDPELPIDPVRPSRPPDPDRYVAPRRLPDPEPHPAAEEIATAAFVQAIAENTERPGETAFRATVHAFMEHNEKFAAAQAKREGLTTEELEELTYFGLMVQETQRFGEVEQLLGREVPQEARERCEKLMYTLNNDFKTRMRALVAEDSKPEIRWALIRETQARYRSEYFAITGMDAALLDDLLAGDARRDYAVAMTPPPEAPPPAELVEEEPVERPAQPAAD